MPLVAGIDSSTQSCKVVIADTDTGLIVREGRASHPYSSEIDPAIWWRALQEAISAAGSFVDVAAWAISAQQHGMVALDSEGQVIRPALLWNDTRSAKAAEDLIAEFGAEQLAARTGCVPVASFTVTKLRWLQDHEPDNARRVHAVALPHDWLTWRLRGFGPSAPRGVNFDELVTDRSDASGTGYWSDAGYDTEIFESALGHDAHRPRVLPAKAFVIDEHDRRVGAGAGDNAGAALGLGLQVGDVAISIGTSGTVFAVSDRPIHDVEGTVAGFADATGNFLPLTATLNAAKVPDAVAELLELSAADFAALALRAEPGAGGLHLLPYFVGERTPNLPNATGVLTGITLSSLTRENVARAAVEGMLGGLGCGVEAITSLGVPAHRVVLIGGGSRSLAVQQIATTSFSIPVEVPPSMEYVAWGAARQAAHTIDADLPPAIKTRQV